MFPIRTILHPTDFSASSEAALVYACALAKDYNADLVLLNVCEPLIVMGGEKYPQVPPNDVEETTTRLNAMPVPDPAVRVSRKVVVGEPAEEIVREARDRPCDIIVMGTHGHTGLARLLLGSVADGVLRHAKCPVLTVRAAHPEK
jgi:nucleotide-binding universal stress UspA family protein